MAKKKPPKPRTKSKLKSRAATRSQKAAKKRTAQAAAKKWYAYCDVRQPPHERDPATMQYLPWAGPMRNTNSEARKDATEHNKHPGHNAMVL